MTSYFTVINKVAANFYNNAKTDIIMMCNLLI